MQIRQATKDDWRAIKQLIKSQPGKLMQTHLPKTPSFFVAEIDVDYQIDGEPKKGPRIVGCCALQIYSKRMAEIRSLAVSEEYARNGVATKLVAKCLERACERGVYEVMAISGVKKLFDKFGFSTFQREKYALFKVLGST